MTTQQLKDFVDAYFPEGAQLKVKPFKILFNMFIAFLMDVLTDEKIDELTFAIFGTNTIEGKTMKQILDDPNFNGSNLLSYIKEKNTITYYDSEEAIMNTPQSSYEFIRILKLEDVYELWVYNKELNTFTKLTSSGGETTGDFIPLTGTETDKQVTGDIQVVPPSGGNLRIVNEDLSNGAEGSLNFGEAKEVYLYSKDNGGESLILLDQDKAIVMHYGNNFKTEFSIFSDSQETKVIDESTGENEKFITSLADGIFSTKDFSQFSNPLAFAQQSYVDNKLYNYISTEGTLEGNPLYGPLEMNSNSGLKLIDYDEDVPYQSTIKTVNTKLEIVNAQTTSEGELRKSCTLKQGIDGFLFTYFDHSTSANWSFSMNAGGLSKPNVEPLEFIPANNYIQKGNLTEAIDNLNTSLTTTINEITALKPITKVNYSDGSATGIITSEIVGNYVNLGIRLDNITLQPDETLTIAIPHSIKPIRRQIVGFDDFINYNPVNLICTITNGYNLNIINKNDTAVTFKLEELMVFDSSDQWSE